MKIVQLWKTAVRANTRSTKDLLAETTRLKIYVVIFAMINQLSLLIHKNHLVSSTAVAFLLFLKEREMSRDAGRRAIMK